MKGNHLGLEPHTIKSSIEFFLDDIKDITGVKIEPTFNRKGAEILFVTPSGDLFADPGTYTAMGYLMLFHELDLDYNLEHVLHLKAATSASSHRWKWRKG